MSKACRARGGDLSGIVEVWGRGLRGENSAGEGGW